VNRRNWQLRDSVLGGVIAAGFAKRGNSSNSPNPPMSRWRRLGFWPFITNGQSLSCRLMPSVSCWHLLPTFLTTITQFPVPIQAEVVFDYKH